LIESFAVDPDSALRFAKNFHYVGSNYTINLRNLVEQILVPFARDYINYATSIANTHEITALPTPAISAPRKIFIVHGHDEGAREAVARFLEKIGFEVIILHEQANRGRTIIEKVEAHRDVGFAVVLLTPDDQGCKLGDELRARPRQNVLLELGYFLGYLGRNRVCALKGGELEIPTDFGGVVYETYDGSGGWKATLGRELQAAGFEIDWNMVMRP
jgi:predicted nucleotide-binding protein